MGNTVASRYLADGARNLLLNCAELQCGETLLIVHEDPSLGWYDEAICAAVASEALEQGVNPDIVTVGAPGGWDGAMIADMVTGYDCAIFLARLGDQNRFAEPHPRRRSVMVYSRDAATLASRYGRTDHRGLIALKDAVNRTMAKARHIEITCALGTHFSGTPNVRPDKEPKDVCIRRFPMGVPAPVDASGFSGRVALSRYLTPTGSQVYDPCSAKIDGTAFAMIEQGRITGFLGEPNDVQTIECHYDFVARCFGIDRDIVHSWHAGIHPACAFAGDASADIDKWCNTVFTNPRFLHFHTCGSYAPGEICWMILDPTVHLDGMPLWENGRLHPERFENIAPCLADWPDLQDLVDHPEFHVGC